MLTNKEMLLRKIFSASLLQLRTIKTDSNLPKTSSTNYPKKIFSGIQPTGTIHLGNYLGAIKQWVYLQNANEDVSLCIVDLHSMTLPHVPAELSHNILEMTATLLACGLDPSKIVLFQQSQVPQHTELCWHLSCISTMARLAHLPQFKEKSAKLKDVPLGLFTYPILQAADILLYKATHVPVGEDQLQHLQLTQELARMFNNRYGETFPMPHAIITEGTARIRNLRNPMKKMSKSEEDPKTRISLLDSNEDIAKNVRKALTDLVSEVSYDPERRPGVSNLITIHSVLSQKTIQQVCEEVKHLDTGKYKLMIADVVVEHIAPIRRKINDYLSDKQYLLDVLHSGTEKATSVAKSTLQEVQERLGIRFENNSERLSVRNKL